MTDADTSFTPAATARGDGPNTMTSSPQMKDIADFHRRFALKPLAKPGFLDDDGMMFRVKFLREEVEELVTAWGKKDLPDAADALVDVVYVALGTMYLMGLPLDALWDEVQRANMTKVRAGNADESKRGSVLDVVKPPGWIAPDIAGVLRRAVR